MAGVLVLALLLGYGLGDGLSHNERTVMVRFLNFSFAGIFAFSTSWILFPNKPLYLFQALNPTPGQLQTRLLRRILRLMLPCAALVTAVCFRGIGESNPVSAGILWLESLLFLGGLSLFSSSRFLRTGPLSQQWQEGERARKFQDTFQEAGQNPGVPWGAVPTLLTTIVVAVAGMMSVVAGAWLQGTTGFPLNGIGGVLLLVLGGIGWLKIRPQADRYFYHTHAFYAELFRNPGGRSDGDREPLPIQSLYWIPAGIRTLAWLNLRQMDRKIPAGRLLIASFLTYWIFLYSTPGWPEAAFLIPVAILIAKNLLILRLASPVFSPRIFQYRTATPTQWFATRVFINLRWTLPLLLLGGITLYFSTSVSGKDWLIWLGADLLSNILISLGLTLKLENRIKYDYV